LGITVIDAQSGGRYKSRRLGKRFEKRGSEMKEKILRKIGRGVRWVLYLFCGNIYLICGVVAFVVLSYSLKACAFSNAEARGIGFAVGVGLILPTWTEDAIYVGGIAIMIGTLEVVVFGMSNLTLYPMWLGATAFVATFLSAYFMPLLGDGRSRTKRKVAIFWKHFVSPAWIAAKARFKSVMPLRRKLVRG
jgi:hypothetical protein